MNFYLKMGLQIVLWNYRGYANSTGFATVKNCISDAEAVYRYASKAYGIRIKILHGYSIGGIAAISLAKKLNSRPTKPIKLLVTDRTLSSIDQVALGFAHNIQSCACFLTAIA
jgi:alpha/beta superfamily hydrolase